MAHNRYFIVENNDPNMDAILELIVQTGQPQRQNLTETKTVIKLHEEDHEHHEVLNQYQEYNHKEIFIVLNNDEWRVPLFEE